RRDRAGFAGTEPRPAFRRRTRPPPGARRRRRLLAVLPGRRRGGVARGRRADSGDYPGGPAARAPEGAGRRRFRQGRGARAGGVALPEVDARTVGITLADLRRVPTRVLVAGGSDKTEAIETALRTGLATHVVIDEATAARVLEV